MTTRTRQHRHPHPIELGDPVWPHVLRALTEDRKPRSVGAIARAAGRSHSATWRILRLLQQHRLVDYQPVPGGRGFEWWLR